MTLSAESLTHQLEPALLNEIEEIGTPLHVEAGKAIIEPGQVIRYMPIIKSGTVKVVRPDGNGHELLLYYLNTNESCALTFTCCMTAQASEIRAIAEEDSDLILIPVEKMDAWISQYPSWKNFVLRTIRDRFTELINTIDEIAFQKLDDRLINYLRQKSEAGGSKVITITHREIADDLATSRVVISRLLKALENENKVLLYRNQIKLLSAFGAH